MWLRLGYILSLGAFLPLDYFKFHVIALLKALVTLRLDGAVMHKDIGAVITANKAEALGVVEPLHFTFHTNHFLLTFLARADPSCDGPFLTATLGAKTSLLEASLCFRDVRLCRMIIARFRRIVKSVTS